MVRDANGHRRLKVDPSCKRVIRSLSNLEYRAGSSVPDPKSDHSHMADALGYACIALQRPTALEPGRNWLPYFVARRPGAKPRQ